MFVASLIQYVLGILYPIKFFIWRCFCKWPLLPVTEWLMKKLLAAGANQAKKRDLSLFIRELGGFQARIAMTAHYGFDDWRNIQTCWHVLARRLLKARYGIKWSKFQGEEWTPLFITLGTWTPEDFRGSILSIAFHATGWAGLAATRFAPRLQNKYYFFFCLFLILNGLLHDYYVVLRRVDPRFAGYASIRAILREFAKISPEGKPEANPSEPTPSDS